MDLDEDKDDPPIQLSLQDGDVWVRWPGLDANVKLGPRDSVCEEMLRFLAALQRQERSRS